MLIIFDLDDTLIATSHAITPFKLEKAFSIMKKAIGEAFHEKALLELFKINEKAKGSKEALLEFFDLYQIPEELKAPSVYTLSDVSSCPDHIPLHADANEVLKALSKEHTLCLVTRGKREYQELKMKRSNLGLGYFSRYIVVEGTSKMDAYLSLVNLYKIDPSKTVVIGDRIELDLKPGKELGFHTIHFKAGRESQKKIIDHQDVDYQVCSLSQLSGMINEIEMKNLLRKL